MNEFTTSITKTINLSEVDFKGQYRINLLMNEFTYVAAKNASALNMWHKDMYGQYGWVVAKQTLKLEAPVELDDQIEIQTMPGKGSFVSFPRYYFIYKSGKKIGECSSIWTLIDLKKRTIVSPKKLGLNFPDITHDIKLDLPKVATSNDLEPVSKRKVVYEDIDTNGHLNNTRHIAWAMDLVGLEYLKEHTLKELSIQYKKEIPPDSIVDLYLSKTDNQYFIEGRINDSTYYNLEMLFD